MFQVSGTVMIRGRKATSDDFPQMSIGLRLNLDNQSLPEIPLGVIQSIRANAAPSACRTCTGERHEMSLMTLIAHA